MKQNLSKIVWCALVAAFLVVSGAAAQVLTGTITGTVSDPTDAVIPAAQVTAKDLATGREYTAVTDTNGAFTLTNLPNGFFEVTINAQGFAKFVSPRVQVNVAQTSKIVAKMELGKSGSEIVVTAEQSVVETESAELKNSIEEQHRSGPTEHVAAAHS